MSRHPAMAGKRRLRRRALAIALCLVAFTGLAFLAQGAVAGARIVSGEDMAGSGDIRPFSLTDQDGRHVTEEDFLGSFQIVYFGYTHCPDVCPTSLMEFTQALDMIGAERAAHVRILFISVDPKRDTLRHLKDYITAFHPQTVAMTGTDAELRAAAKSYHVRFRLTVPDEDGDYEVDHTASAVLMGPDGRYLKRWAYGTAPEEMASDLESYMGGSGS
ncbi:SCO family protein [Afifella sp. IM 167]|uniref:SCO family protein n=1 Tax=Afifella sp. IM 167 TaxID=2033586 RepID=UPI001CCACE36|nr:SCO family protein [Afifella sp. IM 167]MBZ8134331.1 SCO family protein [Afifella sp. IM 167]